MATKYLPKLGFAIIMVGFVYLINELLDHDVPLNIATWGLWMIIDTTVLASLIAGGNKRPYVMAGFATGATAVTVIALSKIYFGGAAWSWGNAETLAAIAALSALITWKFMTGNRRIIAVVTAMYIAMIPTLMDQWVNPEVHDPLFWGLCTIGCLLEFIGKPKTIAGALMPFCGTIANGLATIFILM